MKKLLVIAMLATLAGTVRAAGPIAPIESGSVVGAYTITNASGAWYVERIDIHSAVAQTTTVTLVNDASFTNAIHITTNAADTFIASEPLRRVIHGGKLVFTFGNTVTTNRISVYPILK